MTRDPHRDQPVLTAGRKFSEAAGAIILVHGRGASAEDILQLRDELDYPELAYVAPQAAENTWYPYSFLAPIEQNEPWLTSALNKLKNIVGNITREGIPQAKIVIAGFSQGACLASEFVARNAANYGGLIAFTGGLIGPPGTDFHNTGKLSGTPVFLGAGLPMFPPGKFAETRLADRSRRRMGIFRGRDPRDRRRGARPSDLCAGPCLL